MIKVTGGSGTTAIHAQEIFSQSYNAVSYTSTAGAILRIFGARIKSTGTTTTGRAIDINSSSASNKIRLFGCVLVASGDVSVNASAASTQVHGFSGVGINKSANGNVTWLGSPTNSNTID